MSPNHPMSNGPKRPRAEEFYGAESKRIKSDDPTSGDGVSERMRLRSRKMEDNGVLRANQ